MKSFFVALACAQLADQGFANRLRAGLRANVTGQVQKGGNPCPDGAENRYPSTLPTSYTILGKSQLDEVWDTTLLREALQDDQEWQIGMPWHISATFTNNGAASRTFGFQGGFLDIQIPGGVVNRRFEAEGNVLSSAEHSEYQYLDAMSFTSGEVIMSNICLTPKICRGFTCPHPKIQKLKSETTFGFTEAQCCEPRLCKDEVQCLPSSVWEPKLDYETRAGSDHAGCCKSHFCPADICDNETGWDKNPSTGLKGSTKEECCVQKECLDYKCPAAVKAKPIVEWNGTANVSRKGYSDLECCEDEVCSNFQIPDALKSVWKLKDDPASIVGSSLSDCCEPRLCSSVQCPNNTEWRAKSQDLTPKYGSSIEECCDQLLCTKYTCSNNSLQKKVKPETRPGSTDEECCEQKFCKDYTCTDPSKWVHFADQEAATNLDRRGFSDEECCEPVHCLASTCSPASMWKPKEGDTRLGRTIDACCEKIYCENFTCDTDDDGNGDGTMWYKRKDTNVYKWQGSSNEECCLPKYCSQYATTLPTKWKKKKQADLQGSTDAECYDPLWCSDYCCVGSGLVHKPGAEQRQGSTDRECCMHEYN